MIVLLAAALVGGIGSFVALWSYGALAAFIGAQLGATALTVLAGLLLAARRAKREQSAAFRLVSNA